MSKFWDWFSPSRKPSLLVVEVEKHINLGDPVAIAALKHHPGFVALQSRLRLQQSLLKVKLCTVRHKDIRDVDQLQSYISGLGYLESEVNRAVGEITKSPVKPDIDELEEFERVRSAIESIGTTSS